MHDPNPLDPNTWTAPPDLVAALNAAHDTERSMYLRACDVLAQALHAHAYGQADAVPLIKRTVTDLLAGGQVREAASLLSALADYTDAVARRGAAEAAYQSGVPSHVSMSLSNPSPLPLLDPAFQGKAPC